jgi:zinc and cadmium transporter
MVDGAVIAASYLVSPALGFATTLAVFLHEIPQEVADYALLIHAGYSRVRALFWNFVSGLTALLGAGVVLIVGGEIETFGAYAAAVTAGAFIYLAAADLIPDLNKRTGVRSSLVSLGSFLVGIALMFALTLLESH